jgi:hypothetical protein
VAILGLLEGEALCDALGLADSDKLGGPLGLEVGGDTWTGRMVGGWYCQNVIP